MGYNPIFPVLGGGTITSGIGTRASPGGIGSTNHKGIDIAAPYGTGVVAPVDMTVVSAGAAGGFGNLVTAKDSQGYTYQFGHLSGITVNPGDFLSGGSLLGYVGSTGNSTGNHLHYGVLDAAGNVAIDKANAILNKGVSKLKDAAGKLVEKIPVVGGAAKSITDGLGITSDCNWLCQFKNWLSESHFFQRFAIVVLALVVIAAAFYLLKDKVVSAATS